MSRVYFSHKNVACNILMFFYSFKLGCDTNVSLFLMYYYKVLIFNKMKLLKYDGVINIINIKLIITEVVIFTMVFLAGCNKKYSVPPESNFNQNKDSVCIVTEKKEYTFSDKYINYRIVNNSNAIFSINKEDFKLERYVDGIWKEYPFKDGRIYTYDDFDINLASGEESTFTITFNQNFNIPMKKGYYRLLQYGLISNVFCIEEEETK